MQGSGVLPPAAAAGVARGVLPELGSCQYLDAAAAAAGMPLGLRGTRSSSSGSMTFSLQDPRCRLNQNPIISRTYGAMHAAPVHWCCRGFLGTRRVQGMLWHELEVQP